MGPLKNDTHVSTSIMGMIYDSMDPDSRIMSVRTYGHAAPEYTATGQSDAKPSRNRRSNNNRITNMLVVKDEGVSQEVRERRSNNNRIPNVMAVVKGEGVIQEARGRIMAPNLKMFTLAELRKATRGFGPDMRLGEGGFGMVYKGWVHENTYAPSKLGVGMTIAVKRHNPDSMQGFEEWQTEIKFLGNYSHPNLVKLLGYCREDKELLLVYEYMQKGSLDNHLYKRAELPWYVRLKVLIGAGRCLALFHEAEEQVILRSFKTSAILLDVEFNAKLSDLGVAKIGPVNSDTHVSTRVMGTYGYAAPEYVATGHSDAKPSRNRRSNDNRFMAPNLKIFTLAELRKATRHFRPDMRLGKGGFGRVFEGWVPSEFGVGMAIAVKRMQIFEDWQTEINFLGNCSHHNLVKLLGFCQEDKELLLVYEYMQNGSLDDHLYNSVKSSYLDWERRYKIIGGVARGLLYLHEDSRLRIFHRNLKAGNVLLDAEMNPKIADFGMARLFDEALDNSTKIVGTNGYMAPEYVIHGEFSVKSDVFSFGVLVLEIVSGQKNIFFRNGEIVEDLASYAWKNWRAGAASNVIDPTLRSSSGSLGEMMRCIHIGLLCVQQNAADRPTMASVALMLNSFSLTLALPSEPAFFTQSSIDPEKEESANFSLNEDSLTDLYPR